jgi:N-acetylmuramoyl-L-alanine amidase
MKYLLISDAGHAEKVAGKEAPDKSFREWKFNHEMDLMLKQRCKDHAIDYYQTNPSPEQKDEIGLTKRAELANEYWKKNGKPNALFVSIHANAYKNEFNEARGTETYVASNASQNSKSAAKYMQNEIYKCIKSLDTNSKDRGVKASDFTVIYKANMPAIVIEYAFYSNREDLKILKNNQSELIEATMRAICTYFGIEYKSLEKNNNTNEINSKFYKVCLIACKDRENAVKVKNEAISKGFTDAYMIYE